MTPAEIDRELAAARRHLAEWELLARRDTSRTDVLRQARAVMDALSCLLGEAPVEKQAKLHALLDRYELLIAKFMN